MNFVFVRRELCGGPRYSDGVAARFKVKGLQLWNI